MTGLLKVPLFDDEILPSYLSRLARANGRVAYMFCRDLGLSYERTTRGEAPDVERLSALCDIPIGGLRHHALGFNERHEVTVLGEVFGKTAVVKDRLRYCPNCFAEDEADGRRRPGTRRYVRGAWLLRDITACATHSSELVELEPHARSRYSDLCELLDRKAGEIKLKSPGARQRSPTEVEVFAHQRLAGVRGHGDLLDVLALSVALDFSRMLGVAMDHGKHQLVTRLSTMELASATLTGFRCLRAGADHLERALDGIAAEGDGGARGAHPTYGRFYSILFEHRPGNRYDSVRRWISDHATRTRPYRPSSLEATAEPSSKVGKREWMTVSSLARAVGMSRHVVKARLLSAGLPVSKVPVEAAGLFERFNGPRLVAKEAAALLGIHPDVFQRFVEQGLVRRLDLNSSSAPDNGRKRTKLYSEREVQTMRASIYERATCPPAEALRSVRQISRRSGISQSLLVKNILDGKYETVALQNRGGLIDDLMLDPEEVHRLSTGATHLLARDAAKILEIRDSEFSGLLRVGALPYREVQHIAQRFKRKMIARADVEFFAKSYINIAKLSSSSGIARNTLRAGVKKLAIKPVFPPEKALAFYIGIKDAERLIAVTKERAGMVSARRRSKDNATT